MPISMSKPTHSKKGYVESLVDIGYSKEKAENLYNKYKQWDKLEKLNEYILLKTSKLQQKDSIPLRDM